MLVLGSKNKQHQFLLYNIYMILVLWRTYKTMLSLATTVALSLVYLKNLI